MHRKIFVYLFLSITLFSCAKKNYLADQTSRTYRLEKGSFTNDVAISDMIAPYKAELDKTMNDIIGYNEAEMVKGKPNSSLTNWFADALYEEINNQPGLKADFAIQNYGGVRMNSFAPGNVTVGTIYEIMPFDNGMYILTLTGTEVQLLLDKIADSNGWPISRTVQFTIEFGKAARVMIHGKTLDPLANYQVAIPDYVANGGDNMHFLKEAPRFDTQKLVRDLLIQHVKRVTARGESLKSDSTKRILLAGE
ncbi:MAG: 5'-nucleotidase C-terminal domain-containing protein [Saprospiraceae bacterium]